MTFRESPSPNGRQAVAQQFFSAASTLLFVTSALAHGMEAGAGAARITDERVSVVVAFPLSAFIRYDDDRDGTLSREEVQRHRNRLRDDFVRQAQVSIVENDKQLVFVFFDVGVPSSLHAGHVPYIRFNIAFEGQINDNGVRFRFDFPYADALRFRVSDERNAQQTPIHFELPAAVWSPILGPSGRGEWDAVGGGLNTPMSWLRRVGLTLLFVLGALVYWLRIPRRRSALTKS